MADQKSYPTTEKLCFVTTGATAPFTALIESVLSPSSVDALIAIGITHLLVQYGTAEDAFAVAATAAQMRLRQAFAKSAKEPLIINGMDFDKDGLSEQFKQVSKTKGLVISHAGSGTILAALRFQVPLIVVPNSSLLDNHQEELAVAMTKSNYLLHGDVKNLSRAIQESEGFRMKMSQFPPITSGRHRETKTIEAIMDETMSFLD